MKEDYTMTAMIRCIVLATRARHRITASIALLIAGLLCLAPERASIVKPAHAQQISGGGGGGGGTPGGLDTQVQYNSSTSFAGSANFIWDNTNKAVVVNGPGVFGGVTSVGSFIGATSILGLYAATNSSTRRAWTFEGDGANAVKFRRWTDNFGAAAASVWSVDNSITNETFNFQTQSVVMMPGSDATHTDSTLCIDSSSGLIYKGSGTAGICLGTSSARFKTDIVPLQAGLPQVMALQPISYKLDSGHGDPDKVLYGFTAEQGATVLPELMGRDTEGRPNTFDYLGIVPVLVKALQEQQAEINELKNKLAR